MDPGQDINVHRTAKAELKEIMDNIQGVHRGGIMDLPRLHMAYEIMRIQRTPGSPRYGPGTEIGKKTEAEAKALLPALRKLERVSYPFIEDFPRRSLELRVLNFRRATSVLETAMKADGIGLISWPFNGGCDGGMIGQAVFYRECEKGSHAAESFRLGKKYFFGTAVPWPCETLNWEYFCLDENLEIKSQPTRKKIKLEGCLLSVLDEAADYFLEESWGTGDFFIDGRINLSAGMFSFESTTRYHELTADGWKKRRRSDKATLNPWIESVPKE